jgi:iron complex transport system ATP-binding protein
MSIVRESVAEGLSAVMAIHDLTIAAQAADRVSLMKKGRIVSTGRGEEVLTSEAIRSVFGVDAIVRTDPDEGALYILPRLAREA